MPGKFAHFATRALVARGVDVALPARAEPVDGAFMSLWGDVPGRPFMLDLDETAATIAVISDGRSPAFHDAGATVRPGHGPGEGNCWPAGNGKQEPQ